MPKLEDIVRVIIHEHYDAQLKQLNESVQKNFYGIFYLVLFSAHYSL